MRVPSSSRFVRLAAGMTLVGGALLGWVMPQTAASASPSSSYVCSGGNIPSGTYASVLVTGVCYVPSGSVAVTGDLTVGPGAFLDATTPAGYPSDPAPLPGTVTVGRNVRVMTGAVLVLGCDAGISCPTATTLGLDSVGGSIIANDALGVVVHAVTIGRNAAVIGGGGGPAQLQGGPGSGACFGIFPPLWMNSPSFAITPFGPEPVFSAFEDSPIGGNLIMQDLQTCWFGAIGDTVSGNVIDQNNLAGDPDANEVVGNTVNHNAICSGNNAADQFGDSGAAPNTVSGNAVGECGFNVVQPDPFFGDGSPQPISVKAS